MKNPPNIGNMTTNIFNVPLIPKYSVLCSSGVTSSKYGSKPTLRPLITKPINKNTIEK